MINKIDVIFFSDSAMDKANVCFICGYERKQFERQEKNFDFHKKHEHDLWRYVYYLIYIDGKDDEEYVGIEYHVNDKFRSKSTDWLPVGKTKFLSKKKFKN